MGEAGKLLGTDEMSGEKCSLEEWFSNVHHNHPEGLLRQTAGP